MKQRVCVGMSGGVDSSVAAYLLQEAGYEVVGLTFQHKPNEGCMLPAVADAKTVAGQLGIAHYVVEEGEAFRREVMEYFVAEYRQGRTPNPCAVCNQKIKFGSLLAKARSLGAEHIATGHYAKVADGQLRKGRDKTKDQSYFLFLLKAEQLAHALLPVGELTKTDVRAIARREGLKTHDKAQSQEICFVPGKDYGRFLRESAKLPDRPGEVVTRDGRVLGTHAGIQYFTIGQREGLGIGGQKTPLYVTELDPAANRVVVGPVEALMRDEFEVADCNWLVPETNGEVTVKIRYNHKGCRAVVERQGEERWSVRLHEPQRAITPGQAAVFYRDDVVLGGGWIC